MPKLSWWMGGENEVEPVFWGRVNLDAAISLWYYRKGELAAKIIHDIKYRGNTQLGIEAGIILGENLKAKIDTKLFTAIVPVPLHPKKFRKRGYNQSFYIAQGLSESLGIPVNNDILFRFVDSFSQTKKSRWERHKNMDGIFAHHLDAGSKANHYLLVDDVITTGSTVEACALALLKEPDSAVSIVSLAFAKI